MSLQEFKDKLAEAAFGQTSTNVQNIGCCIYCKHKIFQGEKGDGPGTVYSQEGIREYKISGICEHCFDKMFEE